MRIVKIQYFRIWSEHICLRMSFKNNSGQELDHNNQTNNNKDLKGSDSNQEDDLYHSIRNINFDLKIQSLSQYFQSVPKIRDCIICLADKLDDIESSITQSITDSVTKTITEKFTSAIDEAFYNYEIQQFQSNELANCEAAKWINVHLPNFRFVKIIYFFDLVFDYLIREKKVPINIKPNRSAKRKRNEFYVHLNSRWDELKPLLIDFMKTDFYTEFILRAEKKFKLVNK